MTTFEISTAQAFAANPESYTGDFPFKVACRGLGEIAEQLGDDLSDSFRVEVNRARGFNSSYHGRPSKVMSILVTRRLSRRVAS